MPAPAVQTVVAQVLDSAVSVEEAVGDELLRNEACLRRAAYNHRLRGTVIAKPLALRVGLALELGLAHPILSLTQARTRTHTLTRSSPSTTRGMGSGRCGAHADQRRPRPRCAD